MRPEKKPGSGTEGERERERINPKYIHPTLYFRFAEILNLGS